MGHVQSRLTEIYVQVSLAVTQVIYREVSHYCNGYLR